MAEQLRRIEGFGPEAMRDIEYELACAACMAPHNRRGGIYWNRHFPWLKPRLAALQGHKCCWCGCTMEDNGPRDQRPTFDHVYPLARGGLDKPDNLAIACYECNNCRGHERPLYRPVMPWHSELLLRLAA